MCGCNMYQPPGCPSAGYPTPGGYPPSYPMPGYPPSYPAPTYPAPSSTPVPIPMTTQEMGGSLASALGVAMSMGQAAVESLVQQVDTRKLCGPWKTDGVNETKLCCTPSVSTRVGIKAAVCIKLTRPYDPWGQQAQPGYTGGAPSWPVPQ